MESLIIYIVPAALLISEALSLIPKLKSNGLFQLIYNIIRWLATKPAPTSTEGD